MSYIDKYNHVHVANINGIPVYWPISNIPAENLLKTFQDENRMLDSGNLLLGGGSGETPALAIDIQQTLFSFLLRNMETERFTDIQENISNVQDIIITKAFSQFKIECVLDPENNDTKNLLLPFDTNDWGFEQFHSLYDYFKFFNNDLKTIDFTTTLIDAIAWFVINNLPLDNCIFNDSLRYVARLLREKKYNSIFINESGEEVFDEFKVNNLFSGVLISKKSGKFSENGMTTYGFSLDDWYNKYGE